MYTTKWQINDDDDDDDDDERGLLLLLFVVVYKCHLAAEQRFAVLEQVQPN